MSWYTSEQHDAVQYALKNCMLATRALIEAGLPIETRIVAHAEMRVLDLWVSRIEHTQLDDDNTLKEHVKEEQL